MPVDVGTMLTAQRREWQPLFRTAGRNLAVGVPGQPVPAVVTPGSLAQVIGTLLENALRHGAGTVTAVLDVSASAVVLSVSDEGLGVPPSPDCGQESSNGT